MFEGLISQLKRDVWLNSWDMESTRKVTSEMGLAVHGDLGQFQINTSLTLKFLPNDSD